MISLRLQFGRRAPIVLRYGDDDAVIRIWLFFDCDVAVIRLWFESETKGSAVSQRRRSGSDAAEIRLDGWNWAVILKQPDRRYVRA